MGAPIWPDPHAWRVGRGRGVPERWTPAVNRRPRIVRSTGEPARPSPDAVLELILDHHPGLIALKEADGLRYVHMSRAYELLGWRRRDFIGRTDLQVFPGSGGETMREDRGVIESGEPLSIRGRARITPSGDTRWLDIVKIPIPGDRDGPGFVLEVAQDVTERERAQADLHSRLARLEGLLEAVRVPLFVEDENGIVAAANRAYRESINRDDPNALRVGAPFMEGIRRALSPYGEWGEAAIEEMARIRASGETVEGEIVRLRDSYIERDSAPISDADGRPLGRFWAYRNVTERENAARELAEARDIALVASRAKSEFLATMSHELRTPMHGVVGTLDLLACARMSDSDRELIAIARRSAEALVTLIDDILDLSKVESGRLEVEQVEFALRPLIEDAAGLMGARALQKGLSLMTHVGPQVPERVVGDPGRIRQILLNLVGNALKFTPDGEVRVRATVDTLGEAPRLRIEVTDTGVGMLRDAAEHIFEPFSQGASNTGREFGGTGLGLTISERLVRTMGGEILVDSVAGVGSTFTVLLPLVPAEPQEGVRAADDASSEISVLLVDPGRMSGETLEAELGALGARVHRVRDVPDPHTLGQSATPDVVVLAPPLPAGSADELATALGGMAGTPGVIVVGGRGQSPPELVSEAQTLERPLRRDTLAEALARASARSTAPGQVQPIERPPAALAPDCARRPRVLLAEDDPIARTLALEQLRRLECDVTAVPNGLEATREAARRDFDVILLDCRMPVMDGYEAAREIRASGGERGRTPILALTAHASEEDRAASLAAGMDLHLSKPLRLLDLRGALADALRLRNEGTTPDEPIVATDDLDRLVDELAEPEAVRRIVSIFLRELDSRLEALRAAARQGDETMLADLGHVLKSAAATVGARRLAALAASAEREARSGNGAVAADLVESIGALGPATASELRAWAAGPCGGQAGPSGANEAPEPG